MVQPKGKLQGEKMKQERNIFLFKTQHKYWLIWTSGIQHANVQHQTKLTLFLLVTHTGLPNMILVWRLPFAMN